MLIQQLNRTDAERVQLIVKNVDGGGSITTGMGVALVATAASGDGAGAVRVTNTLAAQFAGVAAQDIPINGFGLVTAWGFAASVAISQSVGSYTITAGDTLRIAGAAGHFTSVIAPEAVSTQMYRYVIALGALADTMSNPRTYMSGLVRAL